MYKFRFTLIFLLCSIFVFLFTSYVQAQDAEIDKVITDVSRDSQKGAISSYTYMMKFSYDRHRKFAGRKVTRLYEAILPARFSLNRDYRHPLILLEDSERVISGTEIMNSRKEVARNLEKTENEVDKKTLEDKVSEDGGYWTVAFSTNGQAIQVNVLQLLKKVRLSNLQHRQVDGKSIISIDFAPQENIALGKPVSYLSKIEGQILIDEKDKRIIRIEGFAPGEFVRQKDKNDVERQKELVFLFSQTKVSEGFWFPQTVWLNSAKLPKEVEAVEVRFNFSNYNKARVDVRDAVEAPKDPNEQKSKEEKKASGNK